MSQENAGIFHMFDQIMVSRNTRLFIKNEFWKTHLRFEISQKLKKQNKNKNLEKRESGSDEGELREDREDRDDAAYLAESGSRKKGKNVD